MATLHPEVEWNRVAEVEGALHGRDAVREFMQPDAFEGQWCETFVDRDEALAAATSSE